VWQCVLFSFSFGEGSGSGCYSLWFESFLVGAIFFVVVWDLLLVVELGGTGIWRICSHNVVCMMINGYASANITW
jgi:hypothetical protein